MRTGRIKNAVILSLMLITVASGIMGTTGCAKTPVEPQHTYYVVDTSLCAGCGTCVNTCPYGAITMVYDSAADKWYAHIDSTKCRACGKCAAVCPVGAIHENGGE